jgi:hypothetical protein
MSSPEPHRRDGRAKGDGVSGMLRLGRWLAAALLNVQNKHERCVWIELVPETKHTSKHHECMERTRKQHERKEARGGVGGRATRRLALTLWTNISGHGGSTTGPDSLFFNKRCWSTSISQHNVVHFMIHHRICIHSDIISS